MKKVEAFEDDGGQLHKTERSAVEADFVADMRDAWGGLPGGPNTGDPVVIAKLLASSTYPMVRERVASSVRRLIDNLDRIGRQ